MVNITFKGTVYECGLYPSGSGQGTEVGSGGNSSESGGFYQRHGYC